MEDKYVIALDNLNSTISKKRTSGAKALRKFAKEEAGPYLFDALKKEVNDPRTWETKYHIIAALGYCKYDSALPFLIEYCKTTHDATILYRSLGDAIFRLSILTKSIRDSLEIIYTFNNFMIYDGAFGAVAMLELIPEKDDMIKIIQLAEDQRGIKEVCGYPGDKTGIRMEVAAACAKWPHEIKHNFLNDCKKIGYNLLTDIAEKSLKGIVSKRYPY